MREFDAVVEQQREFLRTSYGKNMQLRNSTFQPPYNSSVDTGIYRYTATTGASGATSTAGNAHECV